MRKLLVIGLSVAAASALFAACNTNSDNPTLVHDLRVMAMQTDPPDLMAATCPSPDGGFDPNDFAIFATPVTLTTLIADPAGQGRDITWEIRACANQGDRNCSSSYDSVSVAKGTTKAGELSYTFTPGAIFLPKKKNEPLLLEVQKQDIYKGLGGIRMPLVIHLQAGDEEIFAQKLMVFSCKFFPEMKQNVLPVVSGIQVDGGEWDADAGSPLPLSGKGPFKLTPNDFSSLQEDYIVPSFGLTPVHLTESWTFEWATTLGRMSQFETGGTDPDGQGTKNFSEWVPDKNATEQDVTFYVVVRDGRGGESWVIRSAHWTP